MQDGRIHIEKINAAFLYMLKASGTEFGAGIRHAVDLGWLELHESGRDLCPATYDCRGSARPLKVEAALQSPGLSRLWRNLS